jgi:hypothetical protein
MIPQAYIDTGEKTYTVKSYKNIFLKIVLDKNGIFLNDDYIVSQFNKGFSNGKNYSCYKKQKNH